MTLSPGLGPSRPAYLARFTSRVSENPGEQEGPVGGWTPAEIGGLVVRQETTQSAGPVLTPPQSPCRLAHLPTVFHADDTPEDLRVALGGGHVQRGGP